MKRQVPVPEKRNSAKDLELFARRIETMLRKGGSTDSIERLICRLITQKKTLAVAGTLIAKWVEWRYGKPIQEIIGAGEGGAIPVQIVTNLSLPKPNA